jgi:hypothetical protein
LSSTSHSAHSQSRSVCLRGPGNAQRKALMHLPRAKGQTCRTVARFAQDISPGHFRGDFEKRAPDNDQAGNAHAQGKNVVETRHLIGCERHQGHVRTVRDPLAQVDFALFAAPRREAPQLHPSQNDEASTELVLLNRPCGRGRVRTRRSRTGQRVTLKERGNCDRELRNCLYFKNLI